MASRFNTKFAFTFAVISMIVVIILGGLGFLAYRANTQRHITAGDELMARGEYIDALKEYGRAVDKEKKDLSFLAKYEEALMKIHPATPSQARQYYDKYLSVFQHKLRYQPAASEIHLEFLKELYAGARMMEHPIYWGALYDAANRMKAGVPQSDPNYVYADLYLGLSSPRRSPLPTREDLQASKEYLATFLIAVPDSDKGWAGRVQVLISEAYRKRDEGNNVLAEELTNQADEYLELARDAVKDRPHPEVAKLYAARLLQRKHAGDNTVTEDQVTQAIDEMVDMATASSDPLYLLDISTTIRLMDRVQGVDRGIEILQEYLKDKPFFYQHRYALAELLLFADRYDESNELSNQIIDAQPVAVSLLSRHLPILQLRSASLIIDCEFKRWEKGDELEKISRLQTMKLARQRLAKLIPDPDTQPLLLRADGKIAYAQGNYHAAADKFEKCLRYMSLDDYEVLLYSAQVLELIGQEGAAIGRINTALGLQQGNLYLLKKKARLQLKLMRFDDAYQTINEALIRHQDDEQVQQLAKIIDDARKHNIGLAGNDIAIAVDEARQAINEGKNDSARAILLGALDENGDDDVRLLYLLAVIELQAEQIEIAGDYLDRALEIQPENQSLLILKSTIGVDDPLERFKLALKISYPTEPHQTVRLAVELLRRADQLSELAVKYKEDGNDEEAVAQQELADRARSEGQILLKRANELEPDHRVILEYLLTQALANEDWQAAEKIIERAKTSNADQAQGLLFKGRYELSREMFTQAVQTLTSATERKPYESHPWRLLGRAYESLGNNSQAQRAYSEAYERDPNDLLVVQWYVSLLERIGKNTSALRVLRSSQSLMNRSQSIKDRWLRLEASIGNLPLAIRERREMYKRQPQYWSNAMQLAALLVQTEPTFEHIFDENGLPEYSSTSWLRLSPEQQSEMIQDLSTQWLLESDKIVDAIQAQRGEILEIAYLRASLLRAQGKITQGEKILTDFLQVHESERTVQMYLAIGEYRIATDQLDSAVSILKEGREYQSDEKREADATLANLYFSKQAYKLAAELFEKLIEANPDRATSLQLVECYVNQKELKLASDLLNEITKQDGEDLHSMMLSASIAGLEADQIYKNQGESAAHSKYELQRAILNETLILYPGDIAPYLQQARSYLNEYRRTGKRVLLSDARLRLNEADEIRSSTSETSYVRTEILLTMGDVQGAIGELNRLLKQTPDDVRARSNLVKLYESKGEFRAALGVVNEALERNPILTAWHTKKGYLHSRLNELEEAALAYSEAFRLKPSPERIIRVTEVSLRVPDPQYADIVAFFNGAGRQFLDGSIKLRSLLARALYGNSQHDLALEQLHLGYNEFTSGPADQQKDLISLEMWFTAVNVIFAEGGPIAIEKFVNEVSNDDPNAYCLDLTARSWFRLGDEGLSRALELQQLALSKCPDDQDNLRAILLINLGSYKLESKDYEGADSAFTEALDYNPNQVTALNNAAYVRGVFLNKPAEALPLAQKAKALSPGDPSILDTLGWTYYLLDQYSEAEDLLRESVKLGPSAGNVYHLASVLFKQGRLDIARIRLNRAAELNPDPRTKADIDRLAADIAKARNR